MSPHYQFRHLFFLETFLLRFPTIIFQAVKSISCQSSSPSLNNYFFTSFVKIDMFFKLWSMASFLCTLTLMHDLCYYRQFQHHVFLVHHGPTGNGYLRTLSMFFQLNFLTLSKFVYAKFSTMQSTYLVLSVWYQLLHYYNPCTTYRPNGSIEYLICLQAHGAVIGGWFGAWPMPLDWERPWQVISFFQSSVLEKIDHCMLNSQSRQEEQFLLKLHHKPLHNLFSIPL